jgi:hypothetical protein
MSDGLRNHELANALSENERAIRAATIAAHAGFIRIEEQTRIVAQHTEVLRALQREVGGLRSAVESLVQLEADRLDIRKEKNRLKREELDLKREEDQISGSYQITKLEHDSKQREKLIDAARDGAKAVGSFFQSKGGLILCGMIVVVLAQALMGTGPLLDLLSGLVALMKGLRGQGG